MFLLFSRGSIWLWIMLLLLEGSSGARILVFLPTLSKSHHFVYRPVIRGLAERGHHVTYVSSLPWDDRPSNVDERFINVSLQQLIRSNNQMSSVDLTEKLSATAVASMYNFMAKYAVKITLEHPMSQELIHSDEKYDIVMSEAMRGLEAFSAFTHKFNATGVTFLMRGDNSWVNELCGLPDNPSYMVDSKSQYSDKMNFWERLHNAYMTVATNMISLKNLKTQQQLVDIYFNYTGWENRPPLLQLVSDQALVLSNSHHSVGYSFPKAPHVKEVGGTNIQAPKPLPEEFKRYLTNSTKGIIYFSLGSNVDLSIFAMGAIVKTFTAVLSRREETVFWRGKPMEGVPDNIVLSQWFPQADVLAQNQTKLFITHGGLLGMMEAIHYGVPMIGLPFFGDQRKNLQHVVDHGYGILLEMANISEASLSWAVNEVIGNPKYTANAQKQSQLFRDRPMKPVDEAVYWIEYVLKHGKVLQPASATMPLYQLYLIDVFAVLTLIPVLTIFIVKKLCHIMIKRISQPGKKTGRTQS